MKDSLKIVGTLRIFKNGKLVATEKNLVVATGRGGPYLLILKL